MSKFNPDFWEVTLSEEAWNRFSDRDHLYHEGQTEREIRRRRGERARALREDLQRLIAEVLSERQREVVELYVFHGLNQRQIAGRLSVAQQVVSQHLYGKLRDGKTVGGAVRKLRKECARRGIEWP